MEEKHWWQGYPWRMLQTNLREIDMADIDADAYAEQLKEYGATVVTLNAAGIIASSSAHSRHISFFILVFQAKAVLFFLRAGFCLPPLSKLALHPLLNHQINQFFNICTHKCPSLC